MSPVGVAGGTTSARGSVGAARALHAALITLASLVLTLWPSIASACPVCGVDNNARVMKVVAVFLAVPYLVAVVVVPAIVRAHRNAGRP